MSSTPIELTKSCKSCAGQIIPGDLVCKQCHTLVHAEELERLSAWAKAYEDKDEIAEAREAWVKVLALLPPESTQAVWVQSRVRSLD